MSASLPTLVDMVAIGKLTADAGPMPAPFPIVDQTRQVQHDPAKTILSEHRCHRTSFALSSKRSGSSVHGAYQWFSSYLRLGTKNAKGGRASGERMEAIFNQSIAVM